jgi:AcrR family transcriptional regulator
MVSERKINEREYRKSLIRKATLDVFGELGIEKVTMDVIAKKSDFGKASLYYYFPSKEDVFNEIMVIGWAKLLDGLDDIVKDVISPRERFIQMLKRLVTFVQEDRTLFEFLMIAPRHVNVETNEVPEWKNHQNHLYGMLTTLLEEGIKKGEFVSMPSEIAMRAIGGIFHGILFLGKSPTEINENEFEALIQNFIPTPDASPNE